MAGYSGTPLPQKLGIKPGHRVLILRAPDGFAQTLGELPQSVTVATRASKGPFNVIVAFCTNTAAFEPSLEKCKPLLDQAGGLWFAWPKKASGVPTDLTEDIIRNAALKAGLVDNKVCAIDETWSGLRVVIRLKDRVPSESTSTSRPTRARAPRR